MFFPIDSRQRSDAILQRKPERGFVFKLPAKFESAPFLPPKLKSNPKTKLSNKHSKTTTI